MGCGLGGGQILLRALPTKPEGKVMTTLRLILGDQLNPEHGWFAAPDDNVVHLLMEVRQETDYVLHHAQKIIAIFAAMRDFARQLRLAGHRVHYLAIDDPANRQALPAILDALIAEYSASAFEYQAPDEWRLDRQLADYASQLAIPGRMVDSEHFYSRRDEAAQLFAERKQWLMEHFYRQMRIRHGVLMAGPNKPLGGQWNFDHDNPACRVSRLTGAARTIIRCSGKASSRRAWPVLASRARSTFAGR
jgi:deoxyribodipyrimidine photolyase-related protein